MILQSSGASTTRAGSVSCTDAVPISQHSALHADGRVAAALEIIRRGWLANAASVCGRAAADRQPSGADECRRAQCR